MNLFMLLSQSILRLLSGDLDHLSKHNSGVSVEESNTGETLAVLERVHNQRLGGLEHNLSHLIGLEGVGVLHLLATSLLTDLPVDLGDTASRATATDETDGRVSSLDLTWDVEGLNLGSEVLDGLEGGIRLEDHDITGTGQVVLVKTLDIHADVVTRTSLVDTLVMHLDSEHLTSARVGKSVGRHEDDFLTGLDNTLLNTSSEHITNTLNLVGTGDRETHGGISLTLGHFDEVVEGIEEGVDVASLTLLVDDVNTGPPGHVGRLGDQVITHPSGDGEDRDGLGDKVGLPANTGKHVPHLIADLSVTLLLVSSYIRVHLVDTDNELLNTEQVNETSVLTGLSLNLSSLVVTLLDGGGKVTVSGHHEEAHISLGGTGNHVLNEISVTGGINDGIVPVVCEELLGGARDGDTTLTLLLLAIHVESEGERLLAEGSGLFLQLLNLTLGDATKLENETTGGGGLAGIDMLQARKYKGKVR